MIRVAVVGRGAIGAVVIGELERGRVPGARLVATVDLGDSLADAIEAADLVVECAGQRALAEIGPAVVDAGRDLLVVSIGAFTDDALLARLRRGPGRVHLTSGAIGGLDLLRAAARTGPLEKVLIVTTKKPATLGVAETDGPLEIMRGPAREIAAAFPRSTNVAAAVALAVGSFDAVEAVVVADPAATLTSHVIIASGPSGDYRFEIRNRPSADNPASSQVVPYAVLSAIEELARCAST
ncbi:aspartate dehydrogenase domain-containing protein [Streptosporangium carneum]|uniref:aspartate dehydrogenase domain-containing protein n=1 Tax=Streptosporangium carneum TaxID=47481 RepID=UPI0022F2F510|nr:aspartate dehydrogenase domain-containing protein [Streptosporangium carneum]